MATQSPPKMWSCDLCGKAFQDRLSRAQHRRVHSRFRPFICVFGVCTKSFSTLSEFQQHQRHHHDLRPHRCTKCSRRFITRKHLAIHSCSRNNRQRHQCHRCSASFTQVMALSKHIRHEHSKMRKILRTGGHGTKTKFKCVASDGKLKILNIEAGQNRTNLSENSDKDDNKILLKITAGKSTTIISPCKSSHGATRKRLKKSKKKRKRPKESRKNGIILSIKNGSVKLPVPKSNPVQIKDSFNADFEPVKQWNNLKLKIRTYPELTISPKDTSTVKEAGTLAASSHTAVLKDETTVNISNVEQTDVQESGTERSPSQNSSLDSKVRNGIVIHKDRSGKLLAEQLHKARTRKRDNVFDSFSDIGIWKVLPSPRTDSPSDVLKLKLSPQKPLRVEPAVCLPMEISTSKYFETSLKAKIDQSGDDSDVFGTSPITDKEDGGLHNVNDSGIEVLSSSSCNRSNGNSVRSVVLDENSPTYSIAEDSPLSFDSPVMDTLNRVEHAICHKCGGKIIETNNNTRSPGNCNCAFSNPNSPFPVHASPAKLAIIPVTDMETDKSFEEKISSDLDSSISRIESCPVIEKDSGDDQSKTNVDKTGPMLTVVIDDVITAPNLDGLASVVDKLYSDTDCQSSRLKLRPRKASVSPNKKTKSEEKSKDKRKKNEKSNACFRELFKNKARTSNVSPVVIIDDDEPERGTDAKMSTESAADECVITEVESEKLSVNKRPLFRVKKSSLSSPTLKSSSAVATSILSNQDLEIRTSEISNYSAPLPTSEEAELHGKSEISDQIGKTGDYCEPISMEKDSEKEGKGLNGIKPIVECLEHEKMETEVGTFEHKDVIKKKPLFRRHTKSCENNEVDCDKNSISPLKRKAHSLSLTTDKPLSEPTKQLENEEKMTEVSSKSDISVIEKKEDLSQPDEECSSPKVSKLDSSEIVSGSDSLNKKISSSSDDVFDCTSKVKESKTKSTEKRKASDVTVKDNNVFDCTAKMKESKTKSTEKRKALDVTVKDNNVFDCTAKVKESKAKSTEKSKVSDVTVKDNNVLDCTAKVKESKVKSTEKRKVSDVKVIENKCLKNISVLSEADNDDSLQQLQDIEDDTKPQMPKSTSSGPDFGLFQQQFLSFLSCNNPVPKDQESNTAATITKSETKSKAAAKKISDKNKKCDKISKKSLPSENKKTDSMSWLKIFSLDSGNDNEERKRDEQSKDDTEFTDDLAAINEKMDISDDDDSNSLDVDDVFESKHLSFLEPKESTTITNLEKSCTSETKTGAKVPPRRPQTAKRSKVPCKVSSRRLAKGKSAVGRDSDDSDDSSNADTWDHVSMYTANSDSDPDFNPFNNSDDDFVAAPIKRRHSIERRSKNSRVNHESLVDDGDSRDSYDNANDDAESHSSRSRRVNQMRKSMCPCCIGSPEKKSREHHTHRKQMYRLPRGHKQFIRSTVKLKELQEKIMQLFLSLFPDCVDIFSQCKVGTEEFDAVMDAVLSNLEKENIPFEQECSIGNNSVSDSVILPVSSQLTVFPAAIVPYNDSLDFTTQGTGLETAANIKALNCTSGTELNVDKTIVTDNKGETQLDAAIISSSCAIAQPETQSISYAQIESNKKCGNMVNDTRVECVSNESVEFQMDQNSVSFISENNDLLTVKSDSALSALPSQVSTSSAYCSSPSISDSSCLASSAIAVALSGMTADGIAIPTCEQVPFEDNSSVLPFDSVVQSDLVITIDLNAAKVPLCRDPKACLQQLQTKLSKLVQYLLPEVELKNYFYRSLDNLEFLLDMMIKANSEDVHVLKDDSCSLEDNVSSVGDNTSTVCVVPIEKSENATTVEKATVQHHEETGSEEKIPVFSVCHEQFEQEIKLHRESLKKRVFGREEEPEDIYETTDVISCIQSLRKIARKKPVRSRRRSDAERRTLFVQEKLQNSHNSTIVCHTNTRSLFSDLEIRAAQKSSHPENSKERFLSDLNLSGSQDNESKDKGQSSENKDKNQDSENKDSQDSENKDSQDSENKEKSLVAIDKTITEEPEPQSEKPENDQLENEQTDSDDCNNESKRKSGDKNIFELMQPQQPETPFV